MSAKPSKDGPFLDKGKTSRSVREMYGFPHSSNAHDIQVNETSQKYINEAQKLVNEYNQIQDWAEDVLRNSSDLETRKEVINKIADFCVKIYELDSATLTVFTEAGKANSFGSLIRLTKDLHESHKEKIEDMDKKLRDRLSIFIDYSFSSKEAAGSLSNYELRQIGTSYMYSIIGALQGVDMGVDAVFAATEAKKRAGIALTGADLANIERHEMMIGYRTKNQSRLLAQELDDNFKDFVFRYESPYDNEDKQKCFDKKLDLVCNYVNNLRDAIHNKYINPQAVVSLVNEPELKVMLDCVMMCENGESENYNKLLLEISQQPKYVAFPCYLMFSAYGYDLSSLGQTGKHISALHLGITQEGKIGKIIKQNVESVKSVKQLEKPKTTAKLGRITQTDKSNLLSVESADATESELIDISVEDDTFEKVSELDLLTRKTEVTQLNNQHKLEKVEDKQKETKETVDIVENKKKQSIESHSNQDKESKNITAEKMHSSTQNSTKIEETTTDKTEQQHKAGRKPVKINGWLFTYIKQEYLRDSQTTEEMRAQFANMSYEEQFSYLYNNRNQLIKCAKAEVQTAIANYEKLIPEERAELDDLCATYPTFALKLEKKKDEIAKKQAEEIKAIRERTAKYKKELRESKKGPENNIKEFFQSL